MTAEIDRFFPAGDYKPLTWQYNPAMTHVEP